MDSGESGPTGPGAIVVSAERVKISGDSIRIGLPRLGERHGEPKVQLVREDGVIRAIDVTCSCGEKIRIRCDY